MEAEIKLCKPAHFRIYIQLFPTCSTVYKLFLNYNSLLGDLDG